MPTTVYRRADDVIFERAGDRVVLLDSAGAELITLNAVGSIVWEALQEPASTDVLADQLSERFADVPRDQLRSDVERFVAQLEEAELVSRHAAS